jgi:hypothetical protein
LARRSNSERLWSLERVTIVMLGVYLAAVGLNVLAARHIFYRNYLHGPAFEPIAVVIGIILVIAGMTMRD